MLLAGTGIHSQYIKLFDAKIVGKEQDAKILGKCMALMSFHSFDILYT